ncbi:eyes absent homolog 3-like isoform X2 [Meriones unguiculatus]|uniref:eyes absent homolog 3-like isoform X2 n=1 Tax=Meriones unguiculatus TaxID=10047 RepID=UPI00293F3CA9|nr:eyes absent homolog 3-like isoform X2 [Meriones unguiculatus]
MQEPGEQTLSQVNNPDVSDQKPETSSLASNLSMSEEIMICMDYIPRSSSDYTSQMYSAKCTVARCESWKCFNADSISKSTQCSYLHYRVSHRPATPAHYSHPSQASSTNASLISTSSAIANIPAAAVASISNQDYPTYTILRQNQYQACYPSSSFGVAGQTNSDAENTTLAATTYQTEKPSAVVPAPAPQRLPSDSSTSPSLSQNTPNKDADDQSRKNMTVKNRGKRKADDGSSQDSELERVFLWELDETIIIFHSLLTGSCAQKYGKAPEPPEEGSPPETKSRDGRSHGLLKS